MATPPPKESRRTRPTTAPRDEPQNPRRKYRRRTTDSLSDSREFQSDDDSYSSMSESLELDPIGSDGEEVDEETGLTGKERQKYLHRKRKQDALDARIGGSSGLSLDDRKAADRDVRTKLVVNAMLIAAWYVFSLSISLVCDLCSGGFRMLTTSVQQMDVLRRAPRLPLSHVHYFVAHDRTVHARQLDTPDIPETATISTDQPSRRDEASRYTALLRYATRADGNDNLVGHRTGQHLLAIHHTDLLYDVQVQRSDLRTDIRLHLPT